MSLLKAVGLSLIVLFGVLAVPVILDGTNDNNRSLSLSDGETGEVSDVLNATLDSSTADNATVTVRDTNTFESQTNTITEGSNATYSFEGGDATVTVDSANNGSANLLIAYDSTYGWDPAAKTLAGNFPLIIVSVLVGVIIIYGAKV